MAGCSSPMAIGEYIRTVSEKAFQQLSTAVDDFEARYLNGLKLRAHQAECLKTLFSAISEQKMPVSGYVNCATGTGKSLIMATLVKSLLDGNSFVTPRVLIVTPLKNLKNQLQDTIDSLDVKKRPRIITYHEISLNAESTDYYVNPSNYDLILFDEAHALSSKAGMDGAEGKKRHMFISSLKEKVHMSGFTATPGPEDENGNNPLDVLLGEQLFEYSIVDDHKSTDHPGSLAPVCVVRISYDKNSDVKKLTQEVIESHAASTLADQSRAVTFSKTHIMSDELHNYFQGQENITSFVIHSKRKPKENTWALSSFYHETSHIAVLNSVGMCDLGYDNPAVNLGISAPTGSIRRLSQRIGRVMRKNTADPDKVGFYFILESSGEKAYQDNVLGYCEKNQIACYSMDWNPGQSRFDIELVGAMKNLASVALSPNRLALYESHGIYVNNWQAANNVFSLLNENRLSLFDMPLLIEEEISEDNEWSLFNEVDRAPTLLDMEALSTVQDFSFDLFEQEEHNFFNEDPFSEPSFTPPPRSPNFLLSFNSLALPVFTVPAITAGNDEDAVMSGINEDESEAEVLETGYYGQFSNNENEDIVMSGTNEDDESELEVLETGYAPWSLSRRILE
jgi:superfamily II DNA or RNA helicase